MFNSYVSTVSHYQRVNTQIHANCSKMSALGVHLPSRGAGSDGSDVPTNPQWLLSLTHASKSGPQNRQVDLRDLTGDIMIPTYTDYSIYSHSPPMSLGPNQPCSSNIEHLVRISSMLHTRSKNRSCQPTANSTVPIAWVLIL